MTINKAELLRQSRRLDRREMTIWLRNALGTPITAAQFNKIMYDLLPLEQVYQTEVIEYIKTVPGAFVWKATAGPYSRQGIPDVCAVIDGHFFGFEIKRPYIGIATRIQQQTLQEIRKAGGTAAVISFREQAKEVIDKWKKAQL
jgi:Holliday junction resolvase